MNRARTLLTVLALAVPALAQEPAFVTVFKAPESTGQPSVRIPALLCTTKDTLLAFAEGRDKATDQASNDLVLSRSTDLGKTWSKARVLVAEDKSSVNNPTVVQDRKSGRIFLHFHVFPPGTKEFDKLAPGPKGATRMGCITSDPRPVAQKIGASPSTVVVVVMRQARIRRRPPSTTASRSSSRLANSRPSKTSSR